MSFTERLRSLFGPPRNTAAPAQAAHEDPPLAADAPAPVDPLGTTMADGAVDDEPAGAPHEREGSV